MELGVTIPDTGVDVREEMLDDALCPLAKPFDIPLAAFPTAAGLRDHGVGAAVAGAALAGPRAGKSSSDWVSKAGLLGAEVGWSRMGCLPAAFEETLASGAGV